MGGPEQMLAQEQGVLSRRVGLKGGLEAEFGLAEKEGTLLLTDRRIIFACGSEREDDLPVGATGRLSLVFTDVEDLGSIPPDPSNLEIPISSVTSVEGVKRDLARPGLRLAWAGAAGTRSVDFTQRLTGRRHRNINDWAEVIERLRAGTLTLAGRPPAPDPTTSEGMIFRVLGDLQEKGVFTIMEQVKREFGASLDSDDVRSACDRLASQGLLETVEAGGDGFYRKRSPLPDSMDLSG